MKTFDEARAVYLKKFDDYAAALRAVVADQDWCNLESREFKQSMQDILDTCRALRNVNDAQLTSKSYAARA